MSRVPFNYIYIYNLQRRGGGGPTNILGSENRRLKYLEVLSSVYTGIPVVASMDLSGRLPGDVRGAELSALGTVAAVPAWAALGW